MKVLFRNIGTLKSAAFGTHDLTVLVSDGSALPSMAFSLLHGYLHHLWVVPLLDDMDTHAARLLDDGRVTMDVSSILDKPRGHMNRVARMLEGNPAYVMGRDYSVISRSVLRKLRVEVRFEDGDLPVPQRQEGTTSDGHRTEFDPDRGTLTVHRGDLSRSTLDRSFLRELLAMTLDMDLKRLVYGDLIRVTRSMPATRAGRAVFGSFVLAASELASLPSPTGQAREHFRSMSGFVSRRTEGLTPLERESLDAPIMRKARIGQAVALVEEAAGGRFEPGTDEGRRLLESGEIRSLGELAPIIDFVPRSRAAERLPLSLAGPRERALFELWAFASLTAASGSVLFWELPEMNLPGEHEFLRELTALFTTSGIRTVIHTQDPALAKVLCTSAGDTECLGTDGNAINPA